MIIRMSKPKTLSQWLDWVQNLHTVGIDLGLERIKTVYDRLFASQSWPYIITVAGTNGKGSCIALLESILVSADYQVGSYTSPHIQCFNERIKINQQRVDDQTLIQAFAQVEQARVAVSLTYFEFVTLVGLQCFAQQSLDFLLLEVGLGGRFDAVNLLDADLAVIMPIDLDHQAWLGNDRETIAKEKAGILRQQQLVVVADEHPPRSLLEQINSLDAKAYIYQRDFGVELTETTWNWWSSSQLFDALPSPNLQGRHQYQNAATVLMVITLLSQPYPISLAAIKQGLVSVKLMARLQLVSLQANYPCDIVLDVAHNPHSVRALQQWLSQQSYRHYYAIFAMLADKALVESIELLKNVITTWYVIELEQTRGIDATELATMLSKIVAPRSVVCCYTVSAGLQQLQSQVTTEDLIIVFGSFYTVAMAYNELERMSLMDFVIER